MRYLCRVNDRCFISLLPLAFLASCNSVVPGVPISSISSPSQPLNCDDSIKAAFKPDALTKVIAVRQVRKGEALIAVDSPAPISAAKDMCMVKLLVGPGATKEKDQSARSYSEGIGIEVWLPAHAEWNQRIRNYGGGGWVGGGHRFEGQIGSKVPAIVNANIGYAVGTTDAGQPWSQDGSFAFLSSGAVNEESLQDFTHRAMVEQATKTQALVKLYYGKAQQYAYYDGHSQGGRQGLKVAQDYPELYDGYLIAQPAVSAPKFGITRLYDQVILKTALGFNALDKARAAAFAKKVEFANTQAVKSCDAPGLGFLLDPFSCNYSPSKDVAVLCVGVSLNGIVGGNADGATCMNAGEAQALDKIWYGATQDGSLNPNQSAQARSGVALEGPQLWWSMTRGTSIAGGLTGANADNFAIAMQDVSYSSTLGAAPLVNTSTTVRNRWAELSHASFTEGFRKGQTLPVFQAYMSDKADLSKLRDGGRKILMHTGLADDAIPPASSINYYHRVSAAMGGHEKVQQFFRMYMIPGMAHSSQGRAYTVGGNNNSVPMPRMPGNGNQTPSPEQDQMFSALVAWVERGQAPNEIFISSRDNGTSYPICVYPKKITWDGSGAAQVATSYSCR